MKWLILWSHEAVSDLERLGPEVADRVTNALDRLAIQGEGDVRRLKGFDPPEYRLRVGKWRIRCFSYRKNVMKVRTMKRTAYLSDRSVF